MERWELSHIVSGSIKWNHKFGSNLVFSWKLKMYTTYEPEILLLGMCLSVLRGISKNAHSRIVNWLWEQKVETAQMSNKKIVIKYSVIFSTMEYYLVVRMNDTYMEKNGWIIEAYFWKKKKITRSNIQDDIILIKFQEI